VKRPLGLTWFYPEDVVPVEKIDPFLLAFTDSGLEQRICVDDSTAFSNGPKPTLFLSRPW
jgi:hypothetical protein